MFLFIEIPQIVISILSLLGKLFRSLTVQEGSEPGQLKLFLFIEIPQIVIYLSVVSLGRNCLPVKGL